MDLVTISELSKGFHISTRTLRYYEQIGLMKSCKKEGYAYRVYDEGSVRRLRQIIILRKLRIPLKQIGIILGSEEQTHIIEILEQNIQELNEEVTALTTIRSILQKFVLQLSNYNGVNVKLNLFHDNELLKIVESLSLTKIDFKEERSMNELNNANKVLTKLEDVRIVYLPPATVASSQFEGENPEETAGTRLDEFVKAVNLHTVKPDLRVYGFNNPSPQKIGDPYGYEFWVTIPEDMDVPKPLVKKEFKGGLYAAHCINMGDFQEWQVFYEWACNHKTYEIELREPYEMGGTMEEHLNIFSHYQNNSGASKPMQLDLLIPIKEKEKTE